MSITIGDIVDTRTPEQRGQVPSVGRVVHYVSLGSADGRYPAVCRAAVVTEVPDQPELPPESVGYNKSVHLCVLNPEGLFFNKYVPFSNGNDPGTWHWPERMP